MTVLYQFNLYSYTHSGFNDISLSSIGWLFHWYVCTDTTWTIQIEAVASLGFKLCKVLGVDALMRAVYRWNT